MLTPQDIQGKEFSKAVFGGYDMSGVDGFLETVMEDYSALYKENAILKGKIKVLVEKVEEYRSTEDAMRMALISAQKVANEMLAKAKEHSEAMVAEAEERARTLHERVEAEADELRGRYRREFADEQLRLESLKQKTKQYVERSRELLDQQSGFLARLDELRAEFPSEKPEPEPPAPEEPPAAPAEDAIQETADKIDEFVNRMLSENDSVTAEDDDSTKRFVTTGDDGDDDYYSGTPRPKFNFDDLQFGTNYNGGKNA